MSARSFVVQCPCCEAKLTIDGELGEIVAHEAPPRKRTVSDIGAAFANLTKQSAEREEKFRREMESQGQKAKLLDRKFQEGLKKAKDDPDRPIRPIDID
jgi:hypothetical protein